MQILELKNLTREEGYIYYRRNFNGTVVLELPSKTVDVEINFVIEMLPTGRKDLELEFVDSFEYPVLPVKNAVTQYIMKLEDEGLLP
jgi:hypothetical protein